MALLSLSLSLLLSLSKIGKTREKVILRCDDDMFVAFNTLLGRCCDVVATTTMIMMMR